MPRSPEGQVPCRRVNAALQEILFRLSRFPYYCRGERFGGILLGTRKPRVPSSLSARTTRSYACEIPGPRGLVSTRLVGAHCHREIRATQEAAVGKPGEPSESQTTWKSATDARIFCAAECHQRSSFFSCTS